MTQGAREVPFVVVDVFTTRRFEGNPLAVITDGRGLATEQMQAIAREFGFSETTFALPPADPAHTARLRIFTPASEIPFAGHPNVGSALVYARAGACLGRPVGDRVRFEENAGLVDIQIDGDPQNGALARVRAPESFASGGVVSPEIIAGCAGLAPDDVATDRFAPTLASVGLPFTIAELRSLEALGRARPIYDGFEIAQARHPNALDRFSLFLVAAVSDGGDQFRARMFAPLGGVWEDPATGSASAAFAGLMAHIAPEPDLELSLAVEQGVEMGRPSQISLGAHKVGGVVRHVHLCGAAVEVMRGKIAV